MNHKDEPVSKIEPSVPRPQTNPAADYRVLTWVAYGLAIAAFIAVIPLVAPLVLAVWAALIAWPLQLRVARLLHNRIGAAAVLTVLVVIAFLVPVSVAALSLSSAAVDLAHRILQSKTAAEGLKELSTSSGGGFDARHLDLQRVVALAREHGARALGAGRIFFGAISAAVIGIVVFLVGFYSLLIEGARARDWFVDRSPLGRGHTQRLANVFAEVGRGILIGTGLTAVLQGGLATVGYFVTGVPQPLVLGLVTICAALIPTVGAALIWMPVTVGLFVSGRTSAAVGMLVIGCVLSTADNVVRPLLARYAKLRMHSVVLFVSMLGGIVVFGGWGLLFGPLLVRLASEALTMVKEEREGHLRLAPLVDSNTEHED
ncbi:MAG: AI-2E family transporter [Polyangiaceae bacterium]